METCGRTTKGSAAGRQKSRLAIAFAVWTLEGMGGSERVVYDLASKLDKNDFKVIIVGFSDGPVRQLFEQVDAKVYAVTKGKYIDLSFIGCLKAVLRQEQVDIVNAHHYGPFFYSFLATIGTRIKLVYTEHSRWQLEQLSPLKKLINRILLSGTDAVVAISKQIEDYYLRNLFLSRKKVHLVLNGIDLDYYHRRDSQNLRENLGIRKEAKIIGTIANLRPEKNHKLLISAFSTVANKIEDVKLLLVGEDCMDREVHRLAGQSGASDKILFLGRRNDVPELLSIFDIFCLPSIYEGLPLTILEAMAIGVPVIGADVMGINEVVVSNQNGLLFPSNDEKRLTEMILTLLSDNNLRNRLAEAGRKSVERYYSLNTKVKEYETLFRTIHNDFLP